MKRRFRALICLLAFALLPLSLLWGCTDDMSVTDDQSPIESENLPSTDSDTEKPAEKPRYYVSAQRDPSVTYITCKKARYFAEKREILDQYYDQMVVKYPEFGKIPREMLQEDISEEISEDKFFKVSFTFYFGGRPTGCKCTFSREPYSAEGKWELEENEFKKFYQSGLTEEQMAELEEMAYLQIDAYIEKYKLKRSDDRMGIYFTVVNGEPCAQSESIADVTPFTTKEFGCGDHAHIFGTVVIDVEAE